MLELMLGSPGKSVPNLLKLVELPYTGTPPVGWSGYSNAMIFDPYRFRAVLHGPDDGLLYPFELADSSFTPPDTANKSNRLREGTQFAETSPMGGAVLKWGVSGSYYKTDMLYVNSSLKYYPASTWTGNAMYFNQCTIDATTYFFGGLYGSSVMSLNNMAVYKFDLNGTGINSDASVTLAPLTYKCFIGHDDASIFIFGGAKSAASGNTVTQEVWRYLLAQKVWQKVSNCPFPIGGGMNTPYYDGKFWFLGATTINNHTSNKELWSYKVHDASWKLEATYPELSTYRTGQLFIYNDTLYYFFPQVGSSTSTKIFTIRLG
ncbi:hypothetical protein ACSA002_1640 [Salmonella phage vB_SalM_SA002]|nr:hypothetical protein ACSA002_1640 [Salmonella phage vB_SalM_SA002]